MEYNYNITTNNEGDWWTDHTNKFRAHHESGYVIENLETHAFGITGRNFNLSSSTELNLHTTIHCKMITPESYFGICWCYLNQNQFYYFTIAPSGYFSVGLFNETWQPFAQWIPTSLINNSINDLNVSLGIDYLHIIINHWTVLKIPKPTKNFGPNLGFVVGPTTTIRVSSLSVSTNYTLGYPTQVENNAISNKEEEDDDDNDDDDYTFINTRGYTENADGQVLINGAWVDASDAEAEYEIDDLMDGYVDDD